MEKTAEERIAEPILASRTEKKRFDYIDVAKGIGILAIIAGHLGVSEINQIVFTFHVPLFFVISGYFLNTKEAFLPFLKKKAKRLLLPYLYTCIVLLVFTPLTAALAGKKDLVRVVLNFLTTALYGAGSPISVFPQVDSIGAIWFLPALFWGLILARFCLENPREKPWRLVVLAAVISLCITTSSYFWLPFDIQTGGTAALYIAVGYGAGKIGLFEKKPSPAALAGSAAVWFCFMWGFKSYWLVVNDFGNGIADFLGSLCGVYVVIIVSRMIANTASPIKKALLFFGKNSLTVLCVHLFELKIVLWVFLISILNEELLTNMTLATGIVLILKILFATAGTLFVQKVSAALKHLKTKRKQVG